MRLTRMRQFIQDLGASPEQESMRIYSTRRKTWGLRPFASAAILILTLVLLLSMPACKSDGGDEDEAQCAEHEVLDGDTCSCETGTTRQGEECLPPADGDEDPDPEMEESPQTDGDPVESSDGDLDDEPEAGDIPCDCPVFEGKFCVDPDIVNPDDFSSVTVEAAHEIACGLYISVLKNDGSATAGDFTCDASGVFSIGSLGCELHYQAENETVLLLCDPRQYNFADGFCSQVSDGDGIDGDADDDKDKDSEPFIDGDLDIDLEDELAENEPDREFGQEVDLESDLEAVRPCIDHGSCDPYWQCDFNSHMCTPGYCSPDNPCPEDYECSIHGFCELIQPDGDL